MGFWIILSRFTPVQKQVQGKDEPLIYLKAAESMQAEPNETLVFEDALHAAKTAKKQDLWLLVSMMKKTGRIFPK